MTRGAIELVGICVLVEQLTEVERDRFDALVERGKFVIHLENYLRVPDSDPKDPGNWDDSYRVIYAPDFLDGFFEHNKSLPGTENLTSGDFIKGESIYDHLEDNYQHWFAVQVPVKFQGSHALVPTHELYVFAGNRYEALRGQNERESCSSSVRLQH